MPTNILSSLMSKAGGWRNLPDPGPKRGGGEQKEQKSPDQSLAEKWLPKLVESHDTGAIEQNRSVLESYGYNVDNILSMAKTKLAPEVKREEAQQGLRILLGLEQPSQPSQPALQTLPTPAEETAQMSLVGTKSEERRTVSAPAPGYTSKFKAIDYNVDKNGIITNVHFEREDNKMDQHLNRLVKRNKMPQEQADALRDTYDLLQANELAGLDPDVATKLDEETGTYYNVVSFPSRPDIPPFVVTGTPGAVAPKKSKVTAAQVDERYRQIAMADAQGQSISDEDQAWAEAYEKQKNISRAGYVEAYVKARLQLPVPVWDMAKGSAVLISNEKALADPDRYKPMSSAEAKAAMPNSTVVTMQQTAPHVMDLISEAENALKKVGEIGPVKSRWRDLWAGKIGTKDPSFTRLKINTNLMMTLLMKMHVGARGSEYILRHFQEMIDAGKQSPENLQAAFNTIRDYAKQIMRPGYGYQGAPQPPAIEEGEGAAETIDWEDLP